MKGLESLGFEQASDMAHQQEIGREAVDAKGFFERAAAILKEAEPIVQASILPELQKHEGHWHPLGFMVYPLGVDPSAGSLRLHVWPMLHRQTLFDPAIPGGSGTHNHAWYVVSRCIAGEYMDIRHQIEETAALPEDQQLPAGWLRVFKPTDLPDGSTNLKTDGSMVKLSPGHQVSVRPKGVHNMVPEEFHLPTVPQARLAATLVLDSMSFGYEPSILISGEKVPDSFYSPRLLVAGYEAEAAREQIFISQLANS